ncbi:FUN14 domain-containing protein [Sporobolomyces koalae]|uniref:FUN14 domain-containing protein n=1 Tax=Sporobolomyces koalae TaxID=500713 RepID=UPI00317009E0
MLFQSTRFPSPLAHLIRQTAQTGPRTPRLRLPGRTLCTATPTTSRQSTSFLSAYRLALFASLPVTAWTLSNLDSKSRTLQCASDRSYAHVSSIPPPPPATPEYKEAESILNLRDLGFGTVSGICVGVFVKKGLRAAAFFLGGIFVFMQYMSSRSLININWSGLTNSYDKFITSKAGPSSAQGGNRLGGLWTWFIDFVGADVQSRATFVAGVLLGFRIG